MRDVSVVHIFDAKIINYKRKRYRGCDVGEHAWNVRILQVSVRSEMLDEICIGEATCRWVAVHCSVDPTQDILINNIRD